MANRWPETIHVALLLLAVGAGSVHGETAGQNRQPSWTTQQSVGSQLALGSRFRWDIDSSELDSRQLWRLPTTAPNAGPNDGTVKPAVHHLPATAVEAVTPIAVQPQSNATATVAHESTRTTRVIVAPPFAEPDEVEVFDTVDLGKVELDRLDLDTTLPAATAPVVSKPPTPVTKPPAPVTKPPAPVTKPPVNESPAFEPSDSEPDLPGPGTARPGAGNTRRVPSIDSLDEVDLDTALVETTVFEPIGAAWQSEAWQSVDAEPIDAIAQGADVGSGLPVVDEQIPLPPVSSTRPRILFQPAVPTTNTMGQAVLRPTVRLADSPEFEILPAPGGFNPVPTTPHVWGSGRIAADEVVSSNVLVERDESSQAWLPSGIGVRAAELWHDRPRPLAKWMHRVSVALNRQAGYDIGVGRERLPFALFEIESTQPLNNFRMRFESASNLEFPDRAEYYWSKIGGKGPGSAGQAETSVDYQTIRMLLEIGTPRLSVGTEIPLVFIDPTVYGNTAGLGDLTVTTKTLMIDGDTFQLTQLLKTQMPTGTSKVGRGNGHTSMEAGLIGRYKWSEDTLLHGVLDLWFPLGGDPEFSGEVLRYGFGYAEVLYDSDSFAVIPTLEFVAWSVLSGQKTGQGRIDNENIINLYPGVRLVRDAGGDLGLFELGLNGGVSVTESHWYRGILRLDLRWSF